LNRRVLSVGSVGVLTMLLTACAPDIPKPGLIYIPSHGASTVAPGSLLMENLCLHYGGDSSCLYFRIDQTYRFTRGGFAGLSETGNYVYNLNPKQYSRAVLTLGEATPVMVKLNFSSQSTGHYQVTRAKKTLFSGQFTLKQDS